MSEIPTQLRLDVDDDTADVRDHRLYGLAAEIRAVEEGHNARVLPDGSGGATRRIAGGLLWFGCTCRSGQYRTSLPVPCKHAALAARRLEREGLARWDDGRWRLPA